MPEEKEVHMTVEQRKENWKRKEEITYICGWDFSRIHGRYTREDDLPWDSGKIVQKYRGDSMKLMDMETGGGEFLLTFRRPYENMVVIEGYPPNMGLCKKVLLPLGIKFKAAGGGDKLPFSGQSFDIVTSRHGDYDAAGLQRVLKSEGLFLTQQVGAGNDRELVELLLPQLTEAPYPKQYLEVKKAELLEHGFEILENGEVRRPIRFLDAGAPVWFARIIEQEFPGFSVEGCFEHLLEAQKSIERDGLLEGSIHRFYIVAKKKQLKIVSRRKKPDD